MGAPPDPDEPPPLSREMLDNLYENAPCGYLSTSADGMILRVNETLLRMTGHRRSALVGRSLSTLLTTSSQLFYETRYLPVLMLSETIQEASLSLRHANGTSLAVLVNSIRIFEPDGSIRGIRSAFFDSTERQDYERDLLSARRSAEASETRVRVLQNASSAFGTSDSEKTIADALVLATREAFDASHAAVLMVNPDGAIELIAGSHPLRDHNAGEHLAFEIDALLGARTEVRRSGKLSDAMRAARVELVTAEPLLENEVAIGMLVTSFGRDRQLDDLFLELQAALTRQAAQSISRVRLQRQLERLALFDQLTGLANRKLFEERLDQAVEKAQRSDSSLALLLLDLDGFKEINDSLGHTAGDAVLREIADRLTKVVREGDLIARFGGDEFVVICEDVDTDAAKAIAERLRAEVAHPLHGRARAFPVTASIGLAVRSTETDSDSSTAIFEAADTAMYLAKAAGKNRVTTVTL